MQEFIDSLDLPIKGEMRNNEYIIDIKDSDDFSTLYNAISLNKKLNMLDNSLANIHESKFSFTDGTYQVNLEADYDNDIYKLVVENR